MNTPVRKVIHVDMDAFYASVEQRDFPELAGKPIAVGGDSHRGVVAAASYEARRYGVHSAMASVVAHSKCRDLIFVPPRFEVYKEVSMQIRGIFQEYTDLVEPLSLDEAFLDVTSNKAGYNSATHIAKEIKARITLETKLTASAGISINKFLAKIASDYHKPNGLFVILPEEVESFIEKLAVERFFGVGKVTSKKMHKLGIHNGLELKQWPLSELVRNFGKTGYFYHQIVRGIDNRPVEPDKERKSLGAEFTFDHDLKETSEITEQLWIVYKEVAERIKSKDLAGKTLTLKIKYFDFIQITRSKTYKISVHPDKMLWPMLLELWNGVNWDGKPIRLLGATVSNFQNENPPDAVQLTMEF